MHIAALIVAFVVGLLQAYILVIESFRWGRPATNRIFRVTAEQAALMKPLAANMGLYNGFLAAGLFWGLLAGGELAQPVLIFFFGCVLVAGIVGTATTGNRRIVLIQGLPALLGLLLLWL